MTIKREKKKEKRKMRKEKVPETVILGISPQVNTRCPALMLLCISFVFFIFLLFSLSLLFPTIAV
ncbi:hypothetical protein [Brevibacillus dissolubilis]|uniref:hypothetical protein n=1 Tax=Brevibacillus dissolubilis TaxID=1844116 RepID=UPI001115B1E9|nr:hypothetical protein [Brevibacillus dissolubilis]